MHTFSYAEEQFLHEEYYAHNEQCYKGRGERGTPYPLDNPALFAELTVFIVKIILYTVFSQQSSIQTQAGMFTLDIAYPTANQA